MEEKRNIRLAKSEEDDCFSDDEDYTSCLDLSIPYTIPKEKCILTGEETHNGIKDDNGRFLSSKAIIDTIMSVSPLTFKCPDCNTIYFKSLDWCPNCQMGNPTRSLFHDPNWNGVIQEKKR